MVSNCNAHSDRDLYVRELQLNIKVSFSDFKEMGLWITFFQINKSVYILQYKFVKQIKTNKSNANICFSNKLQSAELNVITDYVFYSVYSM
jgi:predicted AAA+ superfamily ATPase